MTEDDLHPLLVHAMRDKELSFRAVGLLAAMIENMRPDGRLPSQRDLEAMHSDGSAAVRNAWGLLRSRGYISVKSFQDKGSHRQCVYLSTRHASSGSPTCGKPALRTSTSNTTTSPTDSSDKTTTRTRTSSGSVPRAPHGARKKADRVGYEMFDGPEEETKPKGRGRDQRATKATDKWNSPEIVFEFQDRVVAKTKRVGQVNIQAMAGVVARWKRDGLDNVTILAGMDMFFGDPRNLRDVGQGAPVWQRFAAFLPKNQVEASQRAGVENTSLENMIKQVEETGDVLLGRKRRF